MSRTRRPEGQRFWSKVEKTDGCWLWRAAIAKSGYGAFFAGGTMVLAHRWSYESCVGPIPGGLHIDHLCRTRACVNPDHLEAVTQQENNARAEVHEGGARFQRSKSMCPRQHPYTEENTYRSPDGRRHCRTCRAEWAAARSAVPSGVSGQEGDHP